MSTNWNDVHIKCPFYKSEKANHINCENIISKEQICKHSFTVKADKIRHMNRCCCSQYKKCVYYRALLTIKYDHGLSD